MHNVGSGKEPMRIETTVPVPTSGAEGAHDGILFAGWLPAKRHPLCSATIGELATQIHVVPPPPHRVPRPSEERWLETCVTHLRLVTIPNPKDRVLSDLLRTRSTSNAHSKVGEQVYAAQVETLNRLLLYLRGHHGQWWLRRLPRPPGCSHLFFRTYGTTIAEESGTRPFLPHPSAMVAVHGLAPANLVAKKDIGEMVEAVRRGSQPDFVWEILANARLLFAEDSRRSSIVEAISALELALNGFASSGRAQERWAARTRKRSIVESLGKHVEELGLRKTVAYLLPLVFSERELSRRIQPANHVVTRPTPPRSCARGGEAWRGSRGTYGRAGWRGGRGAGCRGTRLQRGRA